MCYSEVSYFTLGVKLKKKVAGHFEDHKKLSRQPNVQIQFLATGGLIKPKETADKGAAVLRDLSEKFKIQKFCNFLKLSSEKKCMSAKV